ncbi:AGRL3-like protein [Mya arenaria]|uniref:AGRL3-like protein n=1 Tax=Mya arenaria TaxID=6604 RepID=A0ABY7G5T1_MYAAR|nr:AGRL3-like protein [Mya arenaria]
MNHFKPVKVRIASDAGISVANGQDENDDEDDVDYSDDTKVRLVDGPTKYEGRVEVYVNGRWGTICDDHFNTDAASVVCRMLHINVTDTTVIQEGYYGEGNGTIWLVDVRCLGYESTIADCVYRNLGSTTCEHSEDVGVKCTTGNEEDNGSVNAKHDNEDITVDTADPETGTVTCAASTENGVDWPEALDGQIFRYRCSQGYQGDIYRRCQNGNYLNPVNNCTRKAIQDLYAQLKQETNRLRTAYENLPTAGDLQKVIRILEKVIEDIEINSAEIESDTDSFFEVANNLLNWNATSSWKSLINDMGVGADSLINIIDRFITKVVNSSNVIEIGQVDKCVNISFPSGASTTDQIVVGCGQEIGKRVFSGGLFKSISGMLPTSSNDVDSLDSSINAPVLSFSFHGHHNKTENVRISFHLFNNSLTNPSCSFWETNRSGKSLWSSDGCRLEQYDREKGIVYCQCNHLTNFAVLMSPASTSETETVHHRRLGVLSIVGSSISIIGLFLTITTYVYFWRAVRSKRSVVLVNLYTVLLLANVLFLAVVDSTSQHALCTSSVVLLHYIFLASFFLMLSEGCFIAQMVFRPHDKRNALQALLGISYGIPMMVVIISAASSKLKGYGNDKFCWLSIDSGLFWAFAGPALAIVFVSNFLNRTGLRSVCVLFPIFGITWSFGVFAVNRETVVFQYLFAIFNSLQGVLIFVVQCILDRKKDNNEI